MCRLGSKIFYSVFPAVHYFVFLTVPFNSSYVRQLCHSDFSLPQQVYLNRVRSVFMYYFTARDLSRRISISSDKSDQMGEK